MQSITIRAISIIIFLSLVFSQEIPNEFFDFHFRKLSTDMGKKWELNSIFGPTRFNHFSKKPDSLNVNARFGTTIFDNYKVLWAFGHFTYRNNFHGYLYPRIVNKPDLVARFSGIPRAIKRGGFNSGETDLSGISFENDWIIIQFGRGRQSWGAGNDIELVISEESNPYDYGMLDLDFGRLRVRYFHGYLETDSLSVNRYITGRGLEWNNNKNLLFGVSEIIIYSGKGRPIDFSYFNPMSTHLEIELNNRQNKLGSDGGNGVWQLSLDYLMLANLKFSFNYLFDEFILDKEQKNQGKGSGRAYSFKTVFTPLREKSSSLLFHLSIISVGANTFRHEEGQNNFVQRNSPLGWQVGNDSREIRIGFDWLYRKKIFIDLDIGHKNLGEKNFIYSLYEPYIDYIEGLSPSGEVENINFIYSKAQYWWRPNISAQIKLEYNNSNKLGKNFDLNIGFDIYYGISKYL